MLHFSKTHRFLPWAHTVYLFKLVLSSWYQLLSPYWKWYRAAFPTAANTLIHYSNYTNTGHNPSLLLFSYQHHSWVELARNAHNTHEHTLLPSKSRIDKFVPACFSPTLALLPATRSHKNFNVYIRWRQSIFNVMWAFHISTVPAACPKPTFPVPKLEMVGLSRHSISE